jgi:hypothetical protein
MQIIQTQKNLKIKKATKEGPIWPADSCDAGIFPETYTIPGNTIETDRVKREQFSSKINQSLLAWKSIHDTTNATTTR